VKGVGTTLRLGNWVSGEACKGKRFLRGVQEERDYHIGSPGIFLNVKNEPNHGKG